MEWLALPSSALCRAVLLQRGLDILTDDLVSQRSFENNSWVCVFENQSQVNLSVNHFCLFLSLGIYLLVSLTVKWECLGLNFPEIDPGSM